jgi:hypothetical protein
MIAFVENPIRITITVVRTVLRVTLSFPARYQINHATEASTIRFRIIDPDITQTPDNNMAAMAKAAFFVLSVE